MDGCILITPLLVLPLGNQIALCSSVFLRLLLLFFQIDAVGLMYYQPITGLQLQK